MTSIFDSLAKRLAAALLGAFLAAFLAFALGELSPTDPVEVSIRVNAMVPTPELIAEVRAEMGLDRPFLARFGTWITGAVQGDFGRSWISGRPVADEILRTLPATLHLALTSFLIILVAGVGGGAVAAAYANRWPDKLIRGVLFAVTALPNFWAALLLMSLFAVTLGWLPTSGMRTPEAVILPAVSLALAYVGTYARLMRGAMMKTQGEDWVTFARARGVPKSRLRLMILRHSITGVVTALGMSIPKLMAGAFVVETIFAWPGVGRLCVSAIFNRDLPVVSAYVLIMAVLFIAFNLAAELIVAATDPRVRRGGGAGIVNADAKPGRRA